MLKVVRSSPTTFGVAVLGCGVFGRKPWFLPWFLCLSGFGWPGLPPTGILITVLVLRGSRLSAQVVLLRPLVEPGRHRSPEPHYSAWYNKMVRSTPVWLAVHHVHMVENVLNGFRLCLEKSWVPTLSSGSLVDLSDLAIVPGVAAHGELR